jgi:hypothetical protein
MTKPLPPDQKKPRGGARPGAGRQKGSATKRTREVADRLMALAAVTPLEILMTSATKHYEAAKASEEAFGLTDPNLELYAAAGELAAKACPYLHPRLSAVEHKGSNTPVKMVIEWKTPEPSTS